MGLGGDFFLTLTIFFMPTIYTLQIKLYFVGNIVVSDIKLNAILIITIIYEIFSKI